MSVPIFGFFEDMLDDLTSGKGQLRFLIQPVVAIILGARLGISDAREGEEPFLWRVGMASHGRAEIMKRSLSDVVIPFCMAIVIDGIVQHYTLGYVRPVAAVLVGLLLVWLPYALSRAITNRICRRSRRRAKMDVAP